MFSQASQDGIVISLAHGQGQSRDRSPSSSLGLVNNLNIGFASGILLTVASVDLLLSQEPSKLGWRVGTNGDAL